MKQGQRTVKLITQRSLVQIQAPQPSPSATNVLIPNPISSSHLRLSKVSAVPERLRGKRQAAFPCFVHPRSPLLLLTSFTALQAFTSLEPVLCPFRQVMI